MTKTKFTIKKWYKSRGYKYKKNQEHGLPKGIKHKNIHVYDLTETPKKNMRCMICKIPLFPYSNCRYVHHHIDYIQNIYIKVCKNCHYKLHWGNLFNHKFGIVNIKWKCRKCGFKQIGAPCLECGHGLTPGRKGQLHDDQRITKLRKDFKTN